MYPDIVGWISAAVLLYTIVRQVLFQWKRETGAKASQSLFIGQLATSIGFAWYSYELGNPVFVVTNVMLAATALVGELLARRQPA